MLKRAPKQIKKDKATKQEVTQKQRKIQQHTPLQMRSCVTSDTSCSAHSWMPREISRHGALTTLQIEILCSKYHQLDLICSNLNLFAIVVGLFCSMLLCSILVGPGPPSVCLLRAHDCLWHQRRISFCPHDHQQRQGKLLLEECSLQEWRGLFSEHAAKVPWLSFGQDAFKKGVRFHSTISIIYAIST